MSDKTIKDLERRAVVGDLDVAYQLFLQQRRLGLRPEFGDLDEELSQEYPIEDLLEFLPPFISQADFSFQEGTLISISATAEGGITLRVDRADYDDRDTLYLFGTQIATFATFYYHKKGNYHGINIEESGWYPLYYDADEDEVANMLYIADGRSYRMEQIKEGRIWDVLVEFFTNIVTHWYPLNIDFYNNTRLYYLDRYIQNNEKEITKLQKKLSETQRKISEYIIEELRIEQ